MNTENTGDLFDKENTLLSMSEWAYRFADHWIMTQEMIQLESYQGKLDYIRDYYLKNEEAILKAFEKSKYNFYHSYPLDWSLIFTPIESDAWTSIRMKGIVLYPQYPVLNYHLDFANPGLKIALELDGAEFHNKEKDLVRDNKLRELGWTIFRIPGKEMMMTNYKTLEEIRDEAMEDDYDIRQKLRYWLLETGDGVIQAIRTIYFNDPDDPFYKSNIGQIYFHFCEKTLIEHQLKS